MNVVPRIALLAVLLRAGLLVAQEDTSLTRTFDGLSAKERNRIAKREQEESAQDQRYQALMVEAEDHFRARRYEESLAVKRRHLPPDHPSLGYSAVNIAAVASDAKDWPRALAGYQEALRIWETALGAQHVELSLALVGMGRALNELGRPAEAEPPLRRALALREHAATAPEHLAEIRFELARARRSGPRSKKPAE